MLHRHRPERVVEREPASATGCQREQRFLERSSTSVWSLARAQGVSFSLRPPPPRPARNLVGKKRNLVLGVADHWFPPLPLLPHPPKPPVEGRSVIVSKRGENSRNGRHRRLILGGTRSGESKRGRRRGGRGRVRSGETRGPLCPLTSAREARPHGMQPPRALF